MGLEKLLYLQGVGAEFVSCSGETIYTSEQDRLGILRCMLKGADNVAAEEALSADNMAKRIYQLDAEPWTRLLPPFQHTQIDAPILNVYINSQSRGRLVISLQLESGDGFQFTIDCSKLTDIAGLVKAAGHYRIADVDYLHYQISLTQALLESDVICADPLQSCVLPYIGLGYHQVTLELIADAGNNAQAEGTWLVAPATSYQGSASRVIASDKMWGVSIQLFSLRSESQWGIGDFTDLTALLALVAKEGGSFVQLNPLHALDIANPQACSPYSPSDRRRLNPLYISLEMVPEFPDLFDEQTPAIKAELEQIKRQVNSTDWLDYQLVSLHKFRIFKQLYLQFVSRHVEQHTPRADSFNQFITDNGDSLRQFCEQQVNDTAAEPEFIDTDSRFFAYLQFVAEQQLQQCQNQAKQLGMTIGLVRDLAVGVASNSVEVNADNSPFCQHASIGAPPDPFAPQGQNWGLTPFDPIALKQSRYQHFIQLLRSNMQSCGALRVDHVMSLLRLWWWPSEQDLGAGAYVYYPLDALLAILCVESQRAQCLIIGEDLGIIPPEIVSKLASAGVLSNELFYFSKQAEQFTLPADYKQQSLLMLANHDVPPLLAWWQANDLQLRRDIGLIDSEEQLQQLMLQRDFDKQQLLALLQHEGALAAEVDCSLDYSQLLAAWLAVTAAGSACLFSVQLCDLAIDSQPVNIPGTWLEYPNWQRRLPRSLTDLAADKQVQALLQLLHRARREGDSQLQDHLSQVSQIQTDPQVKAPSAAAEPLSLQPNGFNRYD